MSSNSLPSLILIVFLFICVVSLTSSVTATDHIIGANKGWNPGLNYSLWANNQTFYVGDYISFRYKKNMHNVLEVSKTGYENCNTEGALGNWTNGKDFIQFKKQGRYYFICGSGCSLGMKVSVVAHPLAPPPSSITEHSSSSTKHPNSAAVEAPLGWLLVGLVSSILMATTLV